MVKKIKDLRTNPLYGKIAEGFFTLIIPRLMVRYILVILKEKERKYERTI